MSEIKHQWNGSVLTVISDSGASSADLKGPKGDTGPRGPQGPGGVIYNEEGELVLDLSEYYSKSEVDTLVENVEVDLSDYATKTHVTEAINNEITLSGNVASPEYVDSAVKIATANMATENYVSTEIAKAQMEAASGGDIDLSGYATKDDLASVTAPVDGATIIVNNKGKLATAVGGYEEIVLGAGTVYNGVDMSYQAWEDENQETLQTLTCAEPLYVNHTYEYAIKLSNGGYGRGSDKFEVVNFGMFVITYGSGGETRYVIVRSAHEMIGLESCNEFLIQASTNFEEAYITELKIWDTDYPESESIYHPILSKYIPIDGDTIIEQDGKIVATGKVALNPEDLYEYSDTDIAVGSELATGKLYLVYE